MKLDTETIVLYAAVGIGGYFLYKKVWGAADAAADKYVADPIAQAYLALTLPGDVTVTGTVQLPTGATVPMSSLYVDSDLQFTYLGRTYTITGRNGNTYTAV